MFVNWCETRYDIKYIEWVSHFHNTDVMSTSYRNTTTTTKIEFPSKFSDWSEQHQQLNLKIIINSFKNSKIKFLRRFFLSACFLFVFSLSLSFLRSKMWHILVISLALLTPSMLILVAIYVAEPFIGNRSRKSAEQKYHKIACDFEIEVCSMICSE